VSPPRVSAVIVSYRVRDLLRRCIETLLAQEEVALDVWVVDNASEDGSAEMVERDFPAVRLVRNDENVGFARANNQALSRATGEVLALANPDTEWPPGALAEAVAVFARHPRAGAVGLALDNPDGTPQPSCFAHAGVFNVTVEALGLHHVARRLGLGSPSAAPPPAGGEGPVDWVSGACLLLRRAAYAEVGGLDERLFMYGEEMDWCWRARARGWSTIYSDRARVVHHGGASGADARGPLYVRNLEARLAFLRNHRGTWRASVAREVMTLGALLRLGLWSVQAAREGRRRSIRTREQLERFRAVVAWRAGRFP
jgi:hypothetical protein